MADVKWIKIVTDIFDDEKMQIIDAMPEHDAIIVIWFKLLCLAGKQNNSGVFGGANCLAYNDEMFAAVFRRPLNTVRMAMQTFERLQMVEKIDDVYTIPNWGKHQNLEAIEARREKEKLRQRKYRQAQKQLALTDVDDVSRVTNALRNADVRTLEEELEEEEDIEGDIKSSRRGTPTPAAADEPDLNTVEAYASNNLRNLSSGNMEMLGSFMDDLPDDVIRYGIDVACGNGKPYWNYVAAILQAWVEAGVKTVGDAKAEREKKPKAAPKPQAVTKGDMNYTQHDYTSNDYDWMNGNEDLEKLYGGGA